MYLFRKKSTFYNEELLALRPTPKLEDHPLSAVRDCLFIIFASRLHIGGRSSIRNLRMCHAVVTGTHSSWIYIYIGCPTRYPTRHFCNNFTTNEDIATKFEADLPHCVRNMKEKNVLLFKFRCNIFFGVRIIKEMPGSVASETPVYII